MTLDAWEIDVPFPAMTAVRQELHQAPIDLASLETLLADEWARFGLAEHIDREDDVAILVGSRGIAALVPVVTETVRAVRLAGGTPFVVPSMGSHGGATASGQIEVLAALGVTEERIGCPIRSTMDTVEIGSTPSGMCVRLDRHAASADGVIVINRVKPHTHFRGSVESGLCKMLALGAGNATQAESIHSHGSTGLARLIPEFAETVIEHAPIIAGLALIEDGRHQLSRLEAIRASEILRREPVLLEEARRSLAGLPLEDIDILIIDRVGKDLSGMGMDTNVTGRVGALDLGAFDRPRIGCIVVLDLTDASHGNATGIGLADIVTARLESKIDWASTYANSLTAQSPRAAARPIVAPNDRAAIGAAIKWLAGAPRPEGQRIVRITTTLDLEEVWLSAGALVAARDSGREFAHQPAEPLQFSPAGELMPPERH